VLWDAPIHLGYDGSIPLYLCRPS
jgi:hypothetical protein